jgi:hypothetical protein
MVVVIPNQLNQQALITSLSRSGTNQQQRSSFESDLPHQFSSHKKPSDLQINGEQITDHKKHLIMEEDHRLPTNK